MVMSVLGNRHWFLYNCLKQIDEENPVDLSTLNKRVEFQKKVYILKALGLPLNYTYGSYIKGPYSTSLARVGYTIYEMPEESIPPDLDIIVPINKNDLENIEILKNMMNDFPKKHNDAYWLELISSLHFLFNQAFPSVKDWNIAKKRLNIWKPSKFDDKDIDFAISLMIKYDLVKIN